MENQKLNTSKIESMKNNLKPVFFLALTMFFSQIVFGWGQTGHRVVAKIAEENLSPKTKKALSKIMGFETLVEASTWMDDIKSDRAYDYARPWHYVTIPDGTTYATAEPSADGDAYEAIKRMKEIVKNETSTPEQKKDAIRMLVHLVGDFHQPFHVGNGQDKGGNDVKIKWFNKSSNIHRIWDSQMIESKQFSYSELSDLLMCSNDKFPDAYHNTDLDLWVSEAVALRPQIYSFDDEENLSYRYLYDNWHTVKTQLLKGGLRLAAVLNEILED